MLLNLSPWPDRDMASRLPASVGALALIALLTLAVATLMVQLPLATSALVVAGLIIFVATFVSAEAGIYIVVFSMLLSPEFGAGGLGGSSATTASRGVTIRAEDLLLVLLGFSWLAHMAVHKDLGLVRRTPLNKPIAYYCAACLLATSLGLLSGHVQGLTGFFYVLKYVEYFVLYFIVANYLNTRSQIARIVVCVLLTAFIVAVVAVAQIPSGQRVSAPFEGDRPEPNTLGGYLLLVGALAGGLALSLPTRVHRFALATLLVILFVPFVFTLSRGSYLALPFVYGTMIVLQRGRRTLLIGLMVLGVVGAILMTPPEVRNRILYTFHQRAQWGQVRLGGVTLDTSTSARINSWKQAILDAARSPLWGYGVTGYGFLDAQYPRILVETGLLGFVFFWNLIRGVFAVGLQLWRHTDDALFRGLAAGLIAGLMGLLVHGLGANTFIIVRVMEPFWLLVGLVACASNLERNTADLTASDDAGTGPRAAS